MTKITRKEGSKQCMEMSEVSEPQVHGKKTDIREWLGTQRHCH